MKLLWFPALAVVLLFLSCSGTSPERYAAAPSATPMAEESFDRGEAKQAAEPSVSVPYETKKLVKTGSVLLEASDPAAVEQALTARVESLGGYVETSSASESYRSLTVRVPATSFDALMEGMKAWGRVVNRQATVQDVTTQYYDLETRLKNQKLLLDQYRAFLSQTKKMDEILNVMDKINGLTTDIESTEGQFRYLSKQVSFSTLSVEITSPLLSTGRAWPDWNRGLSDLAHTLADFASSTVFFLLASVVIGPVLFGLVALVVWLFVGRPGLWRRLKGLRSKG